MNPRTSLIVSACLAFVAFGLALIAIGLAVSAKTTTTTTTTTKYSVVGPATTYR
jgi:hypothetical protein